MMDPGLATVHAQPVEPLPPTGREFSFPERSTVHRLKVLRQELFKKGRLAEALRIAQRLMELAPGRESACRLGVIQRELGQYRESLKTFRDALRFKDGPAYALPEIYLHAAFAWYRLHDYKRMGENLRRAYALRPKTRSDYALHMTLGGHYMSRKAYDEAGREFEKAAGAGQTTLHKGRALVNQGVAAFYAGSLADAGRLFESALLIHKRGGHAQDYARARYLRAACHFAEGRYTQAYGAYTRSARIFQRLKLSEQEAVSWGDAGYARVMLEDWTGAKALLDRAASMAARLQHLRLTVVVHALRAQVQARLGAFKEADKDLAAAKKALLGTRDYLGSAHIYRAQARIAELFGHWSEMRLHARKAERAALREKDRARVVEFRALRARAEHELGRRRAEIHARKGAAWVGDLVGRGSKLMEAVRHHALRLAKTELSLLLTGEDGSGKTTLAYELHAASARAKGPCERVACETLVFASSELNGHVEGAWTGARGKAEGQVRKAAGGTLILDRVDELDVDAQRVLIPIVDGRIRAVGSAVEERVDVRVIAVCRNPDRLIPDLRRRLEGARVVLPPLRERAEDVPALVRSLLGEKAKISEDALALLARQPWDGNLTELKAVLERMAAVPGPYGVQAVQAALPRRPSRQARQARQLAQMAAALSS
jgi:transcriptional regulator with AAA-type ATPase domain